VGAHEPVVTDARDGGVRVITLDRPPANAIDDSLLAALDHTLADAETDTAVRALVVTGRGPFFCAGFDLRAPQRGDAVSARIVELYRSAHRRLLAMPKPTVALVNGHAVAGGLVIALACDVRIGVEVPATIGLNEVAIGASFPTAAIEIVRVRLSAAVAAELTLQAQLRPLADGVRLGIIERMVPSAGALDDAVATAARLGAYPREVFAHTKQSLLADALARIDAVPQEVELEIAALWTTAESRVARAAQRSVLSTPRSL
jgi:enoyl-CoA hydratase